MIKKVFKLNDKITTYKDFYDLPYGTIAHSKNHYQLIHMKDVYFIHEKHTVKENGKRVIKKKKVRQWAWIKFFEKHGYKNFTIVNLP